MRVNLLCVLALAVACSGDKKANDSDKDKVPANAKGDDSKTALDDKPAAAPDDKKADRPAAPKPPAAGTVRIAVVFDTELLRSEEKALKAMDKVLAKEKAWTLTRAAADAAEATAARGLWDGGELSVLPPAWRDSETVVVLEVLPPTGKKPKRVTQGLGSVLILRPPGLVPAYVESVAGEAGWWLEGEALGKWLSNLIKLVGGPS